MNRQEFQLRLVTDFSEEQTAPVTQNANSLMEVSMTQGLNQRYLDPPRQLPKRHYSLQPDMMGGWKPKKDNKSHKHNVFLINYDQQVVDDIVRQLLKNKQKYKESIIYLGPRKGNTYLLHEGRPYQNPYPSNKKIEQTIPTRKGMPPNPRLFNCSLTFDSDFEGGNLDVVIHREANEFDLFMRVDTNTQGHTNWYYFTVCNKSYIGSVIFNICNFKRETSLYQRGLKPYVRSKLSDETWQQSGFDVSYERKKPRYTFLADSEFESLKDLLNTFFTMSFSYEFKTPNDTVEFAYCIPYLYTHLCSFVSTLQNVHYMPALKSLSGLDIPVLRITNQTEDQVNKKTVLVTARVHPGQSNSSFVAEGFLQFITSSDVIAKQIRNRYVIYVIPMLNPDGVVSGNYRTSLFGKDLNRTYDKPRRFAFPQTYYLLQLARDLKKTHKKRFCLYIDLHGHSVKKNVFAYGPDFGIQHSNYDICRELPKILGNITTYFRFYSCIFRISEQKLSTARAVFNRTLEVPFTYTIQSSNGFYYDSTSMKEANFTAAKWKQMGMFIGKGLHQLKLQKMPKLMRALTQKLTKQTIELDNVSKTISDDQFQQGNSDSQPACDDLPEELLIQIQNKIRGKPLKKNEADKSELFTKEKETKKDAVIEIKAKHTKNEKNQKNQPPIPKQVPVASTSAVHKKVERDNVYFPPVNTMNRAQIFQNRNIRKSIIKRDRLWEDAKTRNADSHLSYVTEVDRRQRVVISQITVIDESNFTPSAFSKQPSEKSQWLSKYRTLK